MDVDWFGHSCLRLREGGLTIITDPYDKSIGYNLPRLRADIVTVSHDSPGHAAVSAVKRDGKTLTRPGEYEIGGTFHHRDSDLARVGYGRRGEGRKHGLRLRVR